MCIFPVDNCTNSLIAEAHHFRVLGEDQVCSVVQSSFYVIFMITLAHYPPLSTSAQSCEH